MSFKRLQKFFLGGEIKIVKIFFFQQEHIFKIIKSDITWQL